MQAAIAGVAVWGPGLTGWPMGREVLAGLAPFDASAAPPAPAPTFLSANERRRAGLAVRLALAVAEQAAAMSGLPAASLRSVFATANGDGALVHAILETLAVPGRPVSPTQFHNSVHNAAAGYWTIGQNARAPASCLGCHDATFAAALLKAVAEVAVEREPVLLSVYDVALPEPLVAHRPGEGAFAAGFVLAPADALAGLGRITLTHRPDPPDPGRSQPRSAALRHLFAANPAARALRLLEAVASGRPDVLDTALLAGHLRVTFDPA